MEGSPGDGINTALVPGSASLRPTTLYTLPLAGCGPDHRVPEVVRRQRAVSNEKKKLSVMLRVRHYRHLHYATPVTRVREIWKVS